MNRGKEPISTSMDKKGVVIVDDSPDNLRLLVGILSEQGYKVRPAPSGVLALATIRKDPPELILLDIMMPDIPTTQHANHQPLFSIASFYEINRIGGYVAESNLSIQ